MPKGPAARFTDPTIHMFAPLQPGPGSPNVLIGKLPAWRGLPAAAAAGLQTAKQASDAVITGLEATTVSTAGTPAGPAAYTAEQAGKTAAATAMASLMASLATAAGAASGGKGTPDQHMCPMPSPVPPHGLGYVIDGSPTVLVNGLPQCRQGDTILETLGPPNKILLGLLTVIVGDQGGGPGAAPLINTGLGPAVDALLAMSPTMVANLNKMKGKVDIEYGLPGKGTFYDANGKPRPKLVVDPLMASNPAMIAQLGSHESGHANYTPDPYVPAKGLRRADYVAQNTNRDLKNEGEAAMTNMQVRQEILAAGGPDIGTNGAQAAKYNQIYQKYPNAADRDKARQEIANTWGAGETPSTAPTQNYAQYYGGPYGQQWDKENPPLPGILAPITPYIPGR